jgi:acyl-CoA reductase-like NAD-dependent aldehyde dehydrogenase
MQTQLLIGGRLVAGEGAVESVLDAASGAEIATVPGATGAQVEAAVAAAEAAFPGWSGGFKRSGYGKDLSVYALEDYTVVRHVMVKL